MKRLPMMRSFFCIACCVCLLQASLIAQPSKTPAATQVSTVGLGWAGNTVNVAVFRRNALTSFADTQFVAYYNQQGYVVLGKRHVADSMWQTLVTTFSGNVRDAHNVISIVADAEGYLHMAWDHHGHPLHYARSITPGSLHLQPMPMIGTQEQKVTYPEFHALPNGSLIFLYRDGSSGNGNIVINKYDVAIKQWRRVHSNLIDGEGLRNAYWQACGDAKGRIHLSWVWRESPDVASNHDMCYAVSSDGGETWQRSNGRNYTLPINAGTAEVAWTIPQRSELINQTAMAANDRGEPFIVSYWRGAGNVPQYQLLYLQKRKWQHSDLGFRKMNFTLSGMGTKSIPVSRPQILLHQKGKHITVHVIFRDAERNNAVSIASAAIYKKKTLGWHVYDVYQQSVGAWEPCLDIAQWTMNKQLHLFVQYAVQADAEGLIHAAPQPVNVLAIKW